MSVKVLPQHHLEFLSLKRGCIGSSESTLIKMPLTLMEITCHGSLVTVLWNMLICTSFR